MATDKVIWASDTDWWICGYRGQRVDGQLYLTDLANYRWQYDPQRITVVHPRFVQDVTQHILMPYISASGLPAVREISRVLLSPLEALRMVNSGIIRGVIDRSTFDNAYVHEGLVVFDPVRLMCFGKELILPVHVDPNFGAGHRGYIDTK